MRLIALITSGMMLFSGGTLFAYDRESAIELLTQHEVRLPRVSDRRDLERGPVIIIFDLEGDASRLGIDRTLIEQAAKSRMSEGRIETRVFDGDFRSDFLLGRLTSDELLSSKIVIAVEVEKEKNDSTYAAKFTLAFIEYPRREGVSNRLLGNIR